MAQDEPLDRQDLRLCVDLALEMVAAETTIVEAEVCASWCERQGTLIQYDTEHPDGAVWESQSCTTFGVGIVAVIEDQDGRRVGFGSENGDISPDGIMLALEDAKLRAVPAPTFASLPLPDTAPPDTMAFYDPETLALQQIDMTSLATEALNGALSTLRDAGFVTHVQVRGHIDSRKEHIMIGNTHGVFAGDTSTGLFATLLARLANEQSQVTGSGAATHVQDFSAYDVGVEAAQNAMQARGSIVLDAGDYAVIFGPQAMADLLQDLLLPGLSLDTVVAEASPFATHYGQHIASPLVTLTDEGRQPRMVGSRAVTGEGLPTGTTPLIERGRLIGLLADAYHAPALAARFPSLAPRNGMRYALHGQSFGMRPGIFPTNVILSGEQAVALDALLEPIANGVYIGGLWHISPHGTRRSGEFTGTIIGPSFHITQGKRARPLRSGTLHLHDNICDLLQGITGLSTDRHQFALATMQSAVLTPAVRCRRGRLVS